MRKITGKALAAVLAMALLTSSFSGTFAFAASSERAGSVSFSGDDEVTLVKDTEDPNEYKFDLEGLIGTMTLTTTDKAEKDVAVDSEDLSFRHAKGDNLISIKDGKARVKSDKTGTETIMVYGEATITRDDRDITLKGQKEITIHVVESGYLFVGVDGVPETKTGEEVPALELSYNDLDVKNVAVYKAVAGANLEATYKKTTVNEDDDPLRIETSSTTRFDVDDEDDVTTIQNRGKGTGTMKLSIKSATGSDKTKFNTTEESTTATILKRIDVTGNVTIDKDGSKTTISPYASAPNMDSDSNVAGYDIKVLKGTNVNVTGSASVGKITDAADVSVEDKAKVGDITDATGMVSISGGTVGALDVKGSVEMSDGTAASIEADENISIVGGTVSGDVLTDKDVTIDAEDDEIDTVVNGKVEATNISVDCSSEDGQIRLAKVVLKDDGELNLTGGNVEITELDCAYEGNVNFVDFQGTLPTILNAQDISVDEDSTVVVTGAVELGSLDIAEGGSIEFRDAVEVESVSGDGKLVVGADKLYVSDSISGDVKLRLAGANVNVGDVAYKAAKDVGSTDAFSGVGFTVERKSVDSNTDSFLVRSVSFAGVALDKSEVTIAKGFSDTVTVSNYPASTSLPAGASIVWDYSDADRDVFDITADGATLTISVKDYDDVYATSNSFELIATVVDSDGYEIEDYDPATCTVTAIPEVVVSSDLSGIVEVPQGSTKDFVVNSQVEAPVTIGTGNVAVHALKTPFANGQATYTIKATGAVGTTAGVYATVPGQNAVKLFIIKVTEPVVTSDTTVDFNLAAGNRYVFKITAPSAPSFTVGNGAVLKTQAGKIDGNDYYFAVYAIGSAGQSTGVYVNGVKVCTVTVG
ncbi:hypothetical protein [Anaeromassilibacillus sp. An250]|uniref:hypothetical protein n=1 Tax=Anaeromassilibacillus sp. An250 TaxID=1965604 RepID=UPI000B373EE6|nr:hypothetical protein [Anaeromassilibacillus sp. An250]OUO75730.1 hypothetical protein B5F54_02025 [Anaeromassilibacillus sp. An250]